jgi:outer membrane protein assembly factor BamE (lipoprotein component of BamABCDE complex)
MRTSVCILLAVVCIGCAANGHIKAGQPSRISVGMTKEQVIKALGKPEYVSADGKSETLNYILERPWWQDRPFVVRLVGGKVESYSVIESTPSRSEVDVKVKADVNQTIKQEPAK